VRYLRNVEGSCRLDRIEKEGIRRGLKIQSVRNKMYDHRRNEIKNLDKMIDETMIKNRFYSIDQKGDENGVKDIIMNEVGRDLNVCGVM
jgi:hypothetical protein